MKTYPLSNAQKRLRTIHRLDNENLTDNLSTAHVLEGEFIKEAFDKALSCMIERHESLRTVFITIDGEPKQKLIPKRDVSIDWIDLRDNDDRETIAVDLIQKDQRTPFDLEKGPLFRFTVIRKDNEQHVLLLSIHHIIADGWSMNVFIGELLRFYNHFRLGRSPASVDLPPLGTQYKDYINRRIRFPEGSDSGRHRDY
jgi:NRPS condensation-like uncharacterized protein